MAVASRGVMLKKYAVDTLGLPRRFRHKSNREILLYKVITDSLCKSASPPLYIALTASSQGGFTPLHWACLRNDRDLAVALVMSGEDMTSKSYVRG